MIKLLRYAWHLRDVPPGRFVFLRREYDKYRDRIVPAARWYRRRALTRTRVLAVVGSLGKTTTSHAIRAALATPDRRFAHSNYGSSLAQNLLRIRPWDARGVLEIGVGAPGQMDEYRTMIRPDLVVVTAIASDHNRSFETLLDTRSEKAVILHDLQDTATAFLNGDDPNVRWMGTQTRARVVTFGLNPENDVRAVDVRVNGCLGVAFEVELYGERHTVESRLVGEHMVYPLLAAIAVAKEEGLPLPSVLERLSRLTSVPSRMELIQLPDGTRILDDSSKSSLESIHAAFAALSRLEGGRKIVVLGSIEEPVGPQGPLYRDLGARLAGFAERVICIGGNALSSVRAGAMRAGMPEGGVLHVGPRWEDGLAALRELQRPGDIILVKGTSTQRLRRVVLGIQGRDVRCPAKHCTVKVRECDACPLLSAGAEPFENSLVRRYIGL